MDGNDSSLGISNWYCGEDPLEIDFKHTIYNACFSDLIYALPHLAFIILTILLLLILGCCTGIRKKRHIYLIQFPGHNARWVLYLILFSLILCELGEGILSDLEVYQGIPTIPHLYVPAILSLVAAVMSMVYYNQTELWRKPHMTWLHLIYWLTALGAEIIRCINLTNDGEVDGTILKYDLNMTAVVVYSLFLTLEIYVIVLKVFKFCYKEETLPEDMEDGNMRYLQGYTSLLSSAVYWWLNWAFKKGYKTPLELPDLGYLTGVHTATYQRDAFTRALKKEQVRAKARKKPLSLYRVFARAFGARMMLGGLLKLISNLASFVPPLALSAAVTFVTEIFYGTGKKDYTINKYISGADFMYNGFVLIFIMFWANIIKVVCGQGHDNFVYTESAHIKASLQAAVYDKTLRLSSYSLSGGAMTMGQIINHMAVDTTMIMNYTQWIHQVWSIPFLLVGYLVILFFQLGVSALIGCVVFILCIPAQAFFARPTAIHQRAAMMKSDERLKRTNELLQGIKLIKLYGWEDMFYTAISKVRSLEIRSMIKVLLWRVALASVSTASPLFVTLISYSLYTKFSGHPLTSGIAFAALSVFNEISMPLLLIPTVIVLHTSAVVSTIRLRGFFEATEIKRRMEDDEGEESDVWESKEKESIRLRRWRSHRGDKQKESRSGVTYKALGNSPSDVTTSLPENVAVRIEGNYTWDETASSPTLSNIDLDIPAGKLTMIVGQVGSGKSSLLSAMLNEMTTVSGSFQWNSNYNSVAYGAQKAWLLNASLQENILFGNEYNKERYSDVIAACSLKPDIEILPGGDQTEIGEKGINLSGGQKQRVSVARAMYSYSQVVVLDDPFSALDMHVGTHLFKEGIEEFLLKQKRTVILVTHQVQYAEKADKIVYMKDGAIVHQGSLDAIRKENAELVASWTTAAKPTDDKEEEQESEVQDVKEERAKLERQVSEIEEKAKKAEMDRKAQSPDSARLIEKEERAAGSVSWRVYLAYIKALGYGVFTIQVILTLIQNGLGLGTNFWLSAWSEAGNKQARGNATDDELLASLKYYIGGYAGLSAGSCVSLLVCTAIVYVWSLFAAEKIHNNMLKTIIRAPMRFFETTPVGRILNRFSSDTVTIDQLIGRTLSGFMRMGLICIAAILVDIIVTWYFVIAVVPILIVYLLLMKVFITSSRELQRLDSINKSPVLAHFSESLGGLSTIRAYGHQQRFQNIMIKLTETSNLTFMYLNASNWWLGIRLEIMGALIVLIVGLTTMTTALTTGNLKPSLVGLAMAYALTISSQLIHIVRLSADLEMQMNAMERVQFYSSIEPEEYRGIRDPETHWPDKGDVIYKAVSSRYASDLDPVLHSINIHFKAGEKIGICGRTGSGKSSLALALFRIIDTFEGEITVDGVNIAHLPLVEVRRRLAIIPQDPVLFTGTIRFNLDASGVHEDDALWEALEIAQLKDKVLGLDLKLDTQVTEGGENFSMGERQLFCLARAFLRKTRILVMDEATASIDFETDAILQNVVATAFKERTVLTIAHRVQTIMDSDRILVLNEGNIAEFDAPAKLLAQEDSIFASLVKAGT